VAIVYHVVSARFCFTVLFPPRGDNRPPPGPLPSPRRNTFRFFSWNWRSVHYVFFVGTSLVRRFFCEPHFFFTVLVVDCPPPVSCPFTGPWLCGFGFLRVVFSSNTRFTLFYFLVPFSFLFFFPPKFTFPFNRLCRFFFFFFPVFFCFSSPT